jgi:hypothetical protein
VGLDYSFEGVITAAMAKTALKGEGIPCRLIENLRKSDLDSTVVHRLEFNDYDADRVKALLGPLDLMPM